MTNANGLHARSSAADAQAEQSSRLGADTLSPFQSSSLNPSSHRPRSIRSVHRSSSALSGTSNTSAYAYSSSPSHLSIRSFSGSRPSPVSSTAGASSSKVAPALLMDNAVGPSREECGIFASHAYHLSPESLPDHSSAAESRLRKMASNSTLKGETRADSGLARSRPTSVYEVSRPAKTPRTEQADGRLGSPSDLPFHSAPQKEQADTQRQGIHTKEKGLVAGPRECKDSTAASKARRKTWFGLGSVVLEESGPAVEAITEGVKADSSAGFHEGAWIADRACSTPGLPEASGTTSASTVDMLHSVAVHPVNSRLRLLWNENGSNGDTPQTNSAATGEEHIAPSEVPAAPTTSRLWTLWRGQATNAQTRHIGDAYAAEPEMMDLSEDVEMPQEASHTTPGHAQGHSDSPAHYTSLQANGQGQRHARDVTGAKVGLYIISWIPYLGRSSAENDTGNQARVQGQEQFDAATVERVPKASLPSMTPAEEVKFEALARMQGVGIQSSSAAQKDVVAKKVENAISTAAAVRSAASDIRDSAAVINGQTKASWVSFFSGRSANPARHGQGPAVEQEPEAMDLDDAAPTSKNAHRRDDVASVPQVSASAQRSLQGDATLTTQAAPTAAAAASKAVSSQSAGGSTLRTIASLTKIRGTSSASNSPQLQGTAFLVAHDTPVALNVSKADSEPPNSRPAAPLESNSTKVLQHVKKTSTQRPNGPNLVVPSFEDTFGRPPRSLPPRIGVLERTLSTVNSYLFSKVPDFDRMGRPTVGVRGLSSEEDAASRLPKAWAAMDDKRRASNKAYGKIAKVCVIGVHGWFTQGLLKTVMGEPTGTSIKFASMMADAVRKHFKDAGKDLNPEAVTVIPLQGDGKVKDRVDKLFSGLLANKTWLDDLQSADALFVAAHSQGAVVSAHLLARLIEQKHVSTARTSTCLLAMCGIHNGPFTHLQSSLTSSYLHYFETAAAKELFEFQSSKTAASQQYAASLQICLSAGVKTLYVGSVDDQVVPLYSALNTTVSHPNILRALYVDGQAFPRTDFLVNLLTFCVAVRNAGSTDHSLLTLLSSSVAGSLYGGLGHSLIYEEPATYALAVRYLFEVTSPLTEPTIRSTEEKLPAVEIEPFEAQHWNPYQLPWALRGLLEDLRVRDLFGDHIVKLIDDYEQWKPVTKVLKDVQFRLQPMTGIKKPVLPVPRASSSSDTKTITKTAPRL
ncbi:hypothetical protein K437DRAFT_187429 [Tilletiaria anomala UBC 951]|uniref:YMC020W-like alpha/beta hydrolase domain-containing protein n=1 Tax=Tilletiaria anomala (strain ATCC 24038 / CBS 436.72 / UBC 951) TaxID=1037660 RepID=A0A066WJ26_TILAU|nr:uncharacterized protein K437DRAFT_187429 [Tilletiaria anomala UBC 951]KDN52558.1 hypothetical protein K437DRAFT_187429 [Tilletiaria anomala UBC 951]